VNRTITIRATVRRVAASILATAFVLTSAPAHAEFVLLTNNVLDTDTGLEWRKFGSLASQGAYNDALGKYEAGSTYRLPTAAEVEDLLDELFPGFVANDATGRCAVGAYPAQLAQAQAFQNQFGGSSSTAYHAMYEDATGQLRALYVAFSASASTSKICLTGLTYNYEQYRNTAPPYPVSNLLVMVLRDAIDVKVPVVTLYDYVHPRDIGLRGAEFCIDGNPTNCVDTSGGDTQWQSLFFDTYYGGDWTQFSLDSNPADFAAGKSAPWVRLRSIDFTPVANTGGACTAPTDTLLGNGLCRRSFVGNYYPWHLTAANASVPGSSIYNQHLYRWATVDNVVVEQIWENMTVDYAPTTPDNPIRPKGPGWSVYIAIKTTSVAAGDDYNFQPAYVDPATLKLGANSAPVMNYQASDVDGDGDTDYTYQFNTGATGITCLDTRITLTGKTYWGVPVAGYDTVVPIGCTETILMDVDPFNATNTIRPNDNYNVTVAILGMRTASGDAINLYPEYTSIADGLNRSSLKLGPAATPLVGTPIVTDIDGDANSDLLVNFNVFNAGIACGDTQVQLNGNKISGIPIMAVDNIVTTDCETGGCHP
jgi:hypothetical protein